MNVGMSWCLGSSVEGSYYTLSYPMATPNSREKRVLMISLNDQSSLPHLPWKNVLFVRSEYSFHAQSTPSSSTSRDLDQNWVAICLLSFLNHHLVFLLALGQKS